MLYNALQYAYFDLYMFKLERKIHSCCLHIASTKVTLVSGKETLSGFADTPPNVGCLLNLTANVTLSTIIHHISVPRMPQQPLVALAGCGEHHNTVQLQAWEQSSITPCTDDGAGQGWLPWPCGDPYPGQWLQPIRQRLSLVPSPSTTRGGGVHDQMISGGDGSHNQMVSGCGCWDLQPLSMTPAVTSSSLVRANRLHPRPQSPALVQPLWLHHRSPGSCDHYVVISRSRETSAEQSLARTQR